MPARIAATSDPLYGIVFSSNNPKEAGTPIPCFACPGSSTRQARACAVLKVSPCHPKNFSRRFLWKISPSLKPGFDAC